MSENSQNTQRFLKIGIARAASLTLVRGGRFCNLYSSSCGGRSRVGLNFQDIILESSTRCGFL